jgi:hypothetical protein
MEKICQLRSLWQCQQIKLTKNLQFQMAKTFSLLQMDILCYFNFCHNRENYFGSVKSANANFLDVLACFRLMQNIA